MEKLAISGQQSAVSYLGRLGNLGSRAYKPYAPCHPCYPYYPCYKKTRVSFLIPEFILDLGR